MASSNPCHDSIKANFSDADITDPLFPRHPTFESFYDDECIQLVKTIFQKDFDTYRYNNNSTTNLGPLSSLNIKSIPYTYISVSF